MIELGPRPAWEPGPEGESEDALSERLALDRDRGRHWEARVRRALSLGELSFEEAKGLGYSPNHDADGWGPLPDPLYHATTAADQVRQHGLRSRQELEQDRGLGLGGGEPNAISFTTNRQVGEAVRDGILEMREVARGELTVAEMIRRAERGSGAERPYLRQLLHYWDKDWEYGQTLPPGVEAMARGRERRQQRYFGGPPDDDPDWEPEPDQDDTWNRMRPQAGGRLAPFWSRPASRAVQLDHAVEFYKHFSSAREHEGGGPPDPLFFGSDTERLAAIDARQVELMEFHPCPGAQGYQLGGMSEWRTASGAAVYLDGEDPSVACARSELAARARAGARA